MPVSTARFITSLKEDLYSSIDYIILLNILSPVSYGLVCRCGTFTVDLFFIPYANVLDSGYCLTPCTSTLSRQDFSGLAVCPMFSSSVCSAPLSLKI